MAVSYKKLWHILVDRNMKKKDLEEAAGITHYQMYKLAKKKKYRNDFGGFDYNNNFFRMRQRDCEAYL